MKTTSTLLRTITPLILFYVISIFAAGHALGQTINTTSRGWYESGGITGVTSDNNNYLAGTNGRGDGVLYRDFFVFNVPSIGSNIFTSATLSLENPVNGIDLTSASSATYELWDYSGDISSLEAGTGGTTAYDELGTGTNVGSFTFTADNDDSFINISLNAFGLADLASAEGGSIAFGGSVPLAEANSTASNYIFAYSGGNGTAADGNTSLTFTTAVVPEPSTWAMMVGGVGILLGFRRRRRS